MNLLSRLFTAGPGAASVDVAEAKRRHESGALVVDVREPHEFRQGHVPSARHIPLGALGTRLKEIPLDREVLVICHSGNRSGVAQRLLLQNGYERVVNVAGGMAAWQRAGLPVKR